MGNAAAAAAPQQSPSVTASPQGEANGENAVSSNKMIPECCRTCGHYMPKFYRIIGRKECAMFTTVDGVMDDRCGAWTPKPDMGR